MAGPRDNGSVLRAPWVILRGGTGARPGTAWPRATDVGVPSRRECRDRAPVGRAGSPLVR